MPDTRTVAPLLTLVKGGDVHAPEPLGRQDILISGEKIVAVADSGAFDHLEHVSDVIDVGGLVVAPGLVDQHVHFLGGGGGDGYDSRAPELQLSDFTANGVTTAVAPLGIDPVSRSLEGLLAKARALTQGGISAYIYTGGFRKPLPHLSGSPWRDAYLIPDVLGVKLALGLERAPTHTKRELIDMSRELLWVERATERRLVMHVHLGPLEADHELLIDVVGELAEPSRLVVTHLNRGERHVRTAIDLVRQGAWADMTCMISPETGLPQSLYASQAVLRMRDAGAALDRVTLSTDGNGHAPEATGNGDWAPYRKLMNSLLGEMRSLLDAGIDLPTVLAMASARPAEVLGLSAKGRISIGADADLIVLGPGLQVREVFARGARLVVGGEPVRLGRYERPADVSPGSTSSKSAGAGQ